MGSGRVQPDFDCRRQIYRRNADARASRGSAQPTRGPASTLVPPGSAAAAAPSKAASAPAISPALAAIIGPFLTPKIIAARFGRRHLAMLLARCCDGLFANSSGSSAESLPGTFQRRRRNRLEVASSISDFRVKCQPCPNYWKAKPQSFSACGTNGASPTRSRRHSRAKARTLLLTYQNERAKPAVEELGQRTRRRRLSSLATSSSNPTSTISPQR